MILESLKQSPKTVDELCKELLVSRSTILSHIKGYNQERKQQPKGLLEEGIVRMAGRGKYNSVIFEEGKPL